jgi:uncharacterized protein (DUF885 family)
MTRHSFLFCFVLCGTMLSATVATAAPPTGDADAAFMHLADDYFDQFYFPANPTAATTAGLHQYDNQLEDYSRAAIEKQIATLKDWEKRVAAVDPKSLDAQTRGDRDLLLNSVRSTLLTLETIRPWEKNPDTYSSGITGSAFTIMERKFASPAERLRSLIAREQRMPAVLQLARVNIKHPPRIFTEVALQQLPGSADFFRKDVPAAFTDVTDKALKAEFAKSNAAVVKALLDYQTWLKTKILTSNWAPTPTSRNSPTTKWSTYRSIV